MLYADLLRQRGAKLGEKNLQHSNNALSIFSVLVLTQFLLGCSTTRLSVTADPKGAEKQVAVGMPYQLPMLSYTITITRSMEECGTLSEGGVPSQEELTKAFTLKMQAVAKDAIVPGKTFNIDYLKLASWTKITSLAFATYPNGVLKSINASASDKGPEIASSLISSGFTIAKLVAGIPPIRVTERTPENTATTLGVCSPHAKNLIELRKKAELAAKKLTTEIESNNDELASYKMAALASQLSDDDRTKAQKLVTEPSTKEAQLKVALEQISASRTALSNSTEIVFPNSDDETKAGKLFSQTGEEALVWMRPLLSNDFLAKLKVTADQTANSDCRTTASWNCAWHSFTTTKLGASVVLFPLGKDETLPSDYVSSDAGLLFRQPVLGRLKICLGSTIQNCTTSTDVVLTVDRLTPQLGRLRSLPLVNGFGQNNTLTATFREDGSLETAKYEDLAARGLGVATVIKDAISGAQSYISDRQAASKAKAVADKADKKASAQAEIDDLQHQVDLYTKQKDLLVAKAALQDPDPNKKSTELVQLESEIALLRAYKEKKGLLEAIAGSKP